MKVGSTTLDKSIPGRTCQVETRALLQRIIIEHGTKSIEKKQMLDWQKLQELKCSPWKNSYEWCMHWMLNKLGVYHHFKITCSNQRIIKMFLSKIASVDRIYTTGSKVECMIHKQVRSLTFSLTLVFVGNYGSSYALYASSADHCMICFTCAGLQTFHCTCTSIFFGEIFKKMKDWSWNKPSLKVLEDVHAH